MFYNPLLNVFSNPGIVLIRRIDALNNINILQRTPPKSARLRLRLQDFCRRLRLWRINRLAGRSLRRRPAGSLLIYRPKISSFTCTIIWLACQPSLKLRLVYQPSLQLWLVYQPKLQRRLVAAEGVEPPTLRV
jgi:hypothetical protein